MSTDIKDRVERITNRRRTTDFHSLSLEKVPCPFPSVKGGIWPTGLAGL